MIKTHFLQYLPVAGKGERERSKGNVRGGVTAKGAMEKSRYVRVIEGKKVRGDDPIKYFLPTGV